ncbi:MAG: class I SAM-dependent methyltransferase [Acidobacteria bacterium]|nr:class I SAM-dependent methyltransferase [Acidobacteriota bacterium]
MSEESARRSSSRLQNLFRDLVWDQLENLRYGRLMCIEGTQSRVFGDPGDSTLTATIRVRDSRFFRYVVFGGSLGAAEAYIRGFWACDNLVNLVRIFCRNAEVLGKIESGAARLLNLIRTAAHRMRRNTLAGSRRNIAAHYDLGNDFFSLFLDETLAYSCAFFPKSESSLHQASIAKFDRICRKLELRAEDHVLEIGSGWGGFALHAASEYGCKVTAATISRKQYEYTMKRVEESGLGDRIRVLLEDYRNLEGLYDKIVSVEMIEAVGYQYFDTYFAKCSGLLKSAGMMCLQAIVFPDQQYERYRRSVDFIREYIFPGGCLPSIGTICRSIGRATDLQLFHLEDITSHYAETLAHWRMRFNDKIETIKSLGFDDEFIRTWEFYFCYCEGGFRERAIGDVQMLLVKPAAQNVVTE